MTKQKTSRISADARTKLIKAAIEQFGRNGRDGASTRAIARAAGVNIAGIAYHFGGKDKLYVACAEYIAGRLREAILARFVTHPAQNETKRPADQLKEILSYAAEFMLGTPEIASFARFVVREQMDPSPAFDIFFTTFMEPIHKRACALWASETGADPDSERTKLKVFALISHVLFFRIARAGALRRLGWTDIGPREIAAIVGLATESLDALVDLEHRRQA